MWKHYLILGFLLTVIAGFVFWTSHRERQTPQNTSTPAVLDASSQHENVESQAKNAEDINEVQRAKRRVLDSLTEEEKNDPYWEKKLAIMDTPAYAAFAASKNTSLYAYLDFFKSQGLETTDKNVIVKLFERKFQEHFPGETPETFEPKARQELVNRLIASDTDNDLRVIVDFTREEGYTAWGSLYFDSDSGKYADWAFDIFENYEPPAADPPVLVETTAPVSDIQLPSTSTEDPLLDDTPTPSPAAPEVLSTKPLVLEDSDIQIESDADFETEFLKFLERTLPEQPEQSSVSDFEKQFRDTFTPERFNTAIQTLNRYGPEEGLRRLKASDPEVATHVEHLIEKNKEERE